MSVDPRGEDLKRLLAEDDGGPLVMLNLLRFADGGRARYAEYAAKTAPFLKAAGATVLYAGDCSTSLVSPDGQEWDAVLLVRYPSRRAFTEMVANPGYQEITDLRTTALEAAVLQATIPWPLG
jgi:uncharacterized protein (DUF1330 family)